jgi:hypothetical protein
MKVASDLFDSRIQARNLLVELSIKEYLQLAEDILDKNEYQRRRVRSSKTVYSLLQTDIQRGCIIPPVVLALTSDIEGSYSSNDKFNEFLQSNKDHLVILDGLQRTYSMIDLIKELNSKGDENELKKVLDHKIRAEFYVGLNRIGILYRMLTLNTGQTPMSLRQQIEILYLDYLKTPVEGIELLRETDEKIAKRTNQYNFREIVEGFNAYLERNEFPIDRADLLDNIQSLEVLSRENAQTDLFINYLKAWHAFVQKITELCGEDGVSEDFLYEHGEGVFGKNAQQIFKKAQAVSGFGASIGRLIDFKIINDFQDVTDSVEKMTISTPSSFIDGINRNMEWIKNNTKKIGNAQRAYFQYFFRELFNPEGDSFVKPELAVSAAFYKYQSQNI